MRLFRLARRASAPAPQPDPGWCRTEDGRPRRILRAGESETIVRDGVTIVATALTGDELEVTMTVGKRSRTERFRRHPNGEITVAITEDRAAREGETR